MEKSQSIKAKLFLLFLALIALFINIKISHADQTYNFYFNPDENGNSVPNQQTPQVQPVVEQAKQPEAAQIKPREIAPTSSYLPKQKLDWGDEYSLLRIGAYAFGSFGHKSREHLGSRESQLKSSAGITLALQMFPLKSWGIFGEGITDKDFKDFAFAAGTEVIPVHLTVFGYEDLIAFGGEIGWSDYEALVINKKVNDTFTMEWFGGAKAHVKLSDQVFADVGLRRSFEAPIWVANAGVSLHF